MSIGISLYPDDAKVAEEVMKNADTAMYHAKRIGRNNYQVFTPDMNVRAVARQSVQQALHHAVEHHGFVLRYQPKVDLATGAITGAEALVRMRGPGQRLVGPAEFVSVAEDTGLILPIGAWVLREACRQTEAWVKEGLEPGKIAVNVSAVEFHGRGFLAGVKAILAETGLDPRRLELELTETGLIQDTEQTLGTLRALKELGVSIAVDDFGTGYSSLSYLRLFPIDTLKIDQSFVQDIDAQAGNAIVSAIIAMGTSLDQRVVAEGIEQPQQLAFLKKHRCAEGQGYYFSQPLEAGAFAALLPGGRTRAWAGRQAVGG
jgi:EAL domain-containing protein (putative c-di-GMP-specific phosphodiesterase class I)